MGTWQPGGAQGGGQGARLPRPRQGGWGRAAAARRVPPGACGLRAGSCRRPRQLGLTSGVALRVKPAGSNLRRWPAEEKGARVSSSSRAAGGRGQARGSCSTGPAAPNLAPLARRAQRLARQACTAEVRSHALACSVPLPPAPSPRTDMLGKGAQMPGSVRASARSAVGGTRKAGSAVSRGQAGGGRNTHHQPAQTRNQAACVPHAWRHASTKQGQRQVAGVKRPPAPAPALGGE